MSDETEGNTPTDAVPETPAPDAVPETPASESVPETPAPDPAPEAPEQDKTRDEVIQDAVQLQKESAESHHTPGTVVLTLIFLLTFAIYYFANWKALADVWYVR